MTILAAPGDNPFVTQAVDYFPFGSIAAKWEDYDNRRFFTGKEYDDEWKWDKYHFGARYYDPGIGRFIGIDKNTQFASGYCYGNNNPYIGVDPDGNLFFLTTPFLLGFAFGTTSYTMPYLSSGDWSDFNGFKALGYGLVGGLGGYAGSVVRPYSAVASNAFSSYIHSVGSYLIEGTQPTIDFGIGTAGGEEGWRWHNPLTSLDDFMSWSAVLEDAAKVEYELCEPEETKEWNRQVKRTMETQKPVKSKGKWDYYPTDPPPAEKIQKASHMPQQNWIFNAGGGDKGVQHFRSRRYHAVLGPTGWVVHANRFPGTKLFGLFDLPHLALEGSVADLNGHLPFNINIPPLAVWIIDQIRWQTADALKVYYDYYTVF